MGYPALFKNAQDKVQIGAYFSGQSQPADTTLWSDDYLTTGEVDEADYRNECKNFTKFRKVFRERIKTVHDYCSGIGEKCEYSGSAGCGIKGSTMYLSCDCNIQFTYCTQTSTSRALEEKFESQGKGSSSEK